MERSSSKPFSAGRIGKPLLIWLVLLLGTLLVLPAAVKRDIRFTKEYPGDLRNRIVGARMIEDGVSPYFYKWKNGDGLRYYDPQAFDANVPSISTSTPFLHRLLIPIADWPQATILLIWLAIVYLLVAGMVVATWRMTETGEQRQALVLLVLLFLMTNAWKSYTWNGQTYMLIPFLAMMVFVCLRSGDKWYWGAAAGTAAACLVLVRPNTLLFFLPFLFFWRRYPLSWKVAFVVPILAFSSWALLSPFENRLWHDYARMLQEQVKVHQDLARTIQQNDADPHYARWEGVDRKATTSASLAEPVKVYSENGNVFVLFKTVIHRKLSVFALALAGAALVSILLVLYVRQRPRQRWELPQAAILGFCLYMVSDLFSPVYRHQYYEVQWLMPLLIAAAIFRRRNRGWYGLLLAGLLLGCIHLPFVKMSNTIGEYLLLAGLLGLVLLPGGAWPRNPVPAGDTASREKAMHIGG